MDQPTFGFFDRRWGECKLCKLLRNQYYAPAGYLARFSVNLATFLWGVIVLSRDNALAPRIYAYQYMVDVMPEDYWALVGMVAAGIGMFRLIHRDRPRWWGALGYFALMFFWVFLTAAIILADLAAATPAGLASITTIAILSIYASASHSRMQGGNPDR